MKKLTILILSLMLSGCNSSQESQTKTTADHVELEQMVKSAGLIEKTTTVDEFKIVYHEGGNGDPILLLHGFGGFKEMWTVFAKSLTPAYRVIAIDLPGHGKSSKLMGESYRIEMQVERLNKFAGTLGLFKFHIAGNSMGGVIAGEYAAAYPEQVLSLALFSTGGIPSARKSEFWILMQQGENILIPSTREEYNKMLEYMFVELPEVSESIREVYFKQTMADVNIKKKISYHVAVTGSPLQLEAKLQDITSPTLILWGDKDRIHDVSSTRILEKGLSNSTTIIMKDIGHCPMMERPEETAGHYMEFLQGSKSLLTFPLKLPEKDALQIR